MTVSKAQGQTLNQVGVFTLSDFFGHGQLYVAASRAQSKEKFKILALDDDSELQKKIYLKNIVYFEILSS